MSLYVGTKIKTKTRSTRATGTKGSLTKFVMTESAVLPEILRDVFKKFEEVGGVVELI